MKGNKLGQVVIFVFLTLLMLFALEQLPALKAGGFELRPVQLLSQIEKESIKETSIAPPILTPAITTNTTKKEVDTISSTINKDSLFLCYSIPEKTKEGVLPIENYSDNKTVSITKFYKKLSKSRNQKVRIAYYGDSFIQGDILTAHLRSFLQTQYGGHGVGFVSITNPSWGFRRSVHHRFDGWESHCSTDSADFNYQLQGIDNRYYIPKENAYLQLSGVKKGYKKLDSCEIAVLYGITPTESNISIKINNKNRIKRKMNASNALQSIEVEGKIGSIYYSIPSQLDARFFGASLEDKTGVCLDNFSLQGASGYQLCGIPLKSLQEWNKERPYDLVVLQYGLNAAGKNQTDFSSYSFHLKKMIHHYKKAFPKTPILIIGIGDRAYRKDGEFKTMTGIKYLMRAQQRVSKEEHVAFWNLYEAMGGEGSIVEMADAHPALANKDYTHINFKGGKHLAKHLFNAIKYGETKYLKEEILK